ncbi:hypothetical protein JOC75_000409 [Metabacillus crassostreae]|uniref:retroviral-like aspartic protease family protein n=1 Tax=Metabacillus crassostreae TaxID=929098 RepID=UPI00195946D4|nr:retroviral-like aspartic protease family protein [Metabacillus crassostreae]MBM7602439.1 hypothetical protein [Metabacillus crassostreae]
MSSIDLLVIEDKDVSDIGILVVKATIDGEDYQLHLDTGANQTIMLEDNFLGSYAKTTDTNDYLGAFSENQLKSISVSVIRVGPIRKEDFELTLIEDNTGASTNLLGIDFLLEHKCSFLIDQSKILVDSPFEEEENLNFHKLHFNDSLPFIEGAINDIKVHALWDTGANMNIVDHSLITTYPNMFQKIDIQGLAEDSGGLNAEVSIYYMDTLEIGGHFFPKQMVAATDLSHFNDYLEQPIDLIVGFNTIRKANWIFDFPNKKWAILSNN